MQSVLLENSTDQWLTPPDVFGALGTFDLDPCAHPEHRTRCALAGYCLPEQDGLLLPWNGRVWMNPPYGPEIPKWMERLALHGNGIAVVPSRTETGWFQIAWKYADAILFPYKRIQFMAADGTPADGATFPNALIAFGQDNAQALKDSGLRGALVTEWNP